jgi:hypothetical protein
MERNEGRRPGTPLREQARGQKESKERQPLPSVWHLLERRLRLIAPDVEKPLSGKEGTREAVGVHRLIGKMRKKGTDREKLIIDLYGNIANVLPGDQILGFSGSMSLKEFQRTRSEVEAMSDEELREIVRQANEEFERKCMRKEPSQPEETQVFPTQPKK